MTATDELRRMLDERGVEWMPSVWSAKDETFYKVGEVGYLATEMSSGRMKVGIEGYLAPEQAVAATLGETPTPPPPTPPKQPPYDELIESLRRDWDIEASWDGLRRFWYVGLTDEGVRKRDEREATLGRATCEVEAENAKLRELVRHLRECTRHNVCAACEYAGDACDFDYDMRELGVEVDDA